jgi:hypothetical protein
MHLSTPSWSNSVTEAATSSVPDTSMKNKNWHLNLFDGAVMPNRLCPKEDREIFHEMTVL